MEKKKTVPAEEETPKRQGGLEQSQRIRLYTTMNYAAEKATSVGKSCLLGAACLEGHDRYYPEQSIY